MGARRWNQRHESLDELASLQDDVRGAVAPAGLQVQSEPSVRAFIESLVGERRSGDVAAEPLEASSVSCGDIITVQAEKAMGQDAAAEEGAELLLHEAGSRLILAARAGEEGLQLFANDSVN